MYGFRLNISYCCNGMMDVANNGHEICRDYHDIVNDINLQTCRYLLIGYHTRYFRILYYGAIEWANQRKTRNKFLIRVRNKLDEFFLMDNYL